MKIREVKITDKEEWLSMKLSLWPNSAEDHLKDATNYFAGMLEGVVFVAERDEGKLCGFVELGLRSYAEDCDISPVPYIEGWYVDEKCRTKGIGGLLIQKCEEWAKSKGYSQLASDAQIDNKTSIFAHKALGFSETERIVCFKKDL